MSARKTRKRNLIAAWDKIARSFECVTDAMSITSLPALKREYPKQWRQILIQGVRPRQARRPTTLDGWLRAGGQGLLLPSARGTTWKEQRSAAARWDPYIARVAILAVDEQGLRRIVRARLRVESIGSKQRWKRDCSFLRKWVFEAQRALGIRPRVARKWRVIPTGDKDDGVNVLCDLRKAQKLMKGALDAELPVQIGLALGCRLETSEIERLDFADLESDYSSFVVRVGSRRGSPGVKCARRVAIPRWLRDLMVAAWGTVPPVSGPLFPHRKDPSRGRTGSQDRLRRVAQRLDCGTASFKELRELGQAIMREWNGSRAAVRGTVPVVGDASFREAPADAFEREQRMFAEAWTHLMSPPSAAARLPKRAPKGCAPDEPERDAALRRIDSELRRVVPVLKRRKLPRSCLEPHDPDRADPDAGQAVGRALPARDVDRREIARLEEALETERAARAAAEDEARAAQDEANAERYRAQRAETRAKTYDAAAKRRAEDMAGEFGAVAVASAAMGALVTTHGAEWLERFNRPKK